MGSKFLPSWKQAQIRLQEKYSEWFSECANAFFISHKLPEWIPIQDIEDILRNLPGYNGAVISDECHDRWGQPCPRNIHIALDYALESQWKLTHIYKEMLWYLTEGEVTDVNTQRLHIKEKWAHVDKTLKDAAKRIFGYMRKEPPPNLYAAYARIITVIGSARCYWRKKTALLTNVETPPTTPTVSDDPMNDGANIVEPSQEDLREIYNNTVNSVQLPNQSVVKKLPDRVKQGGFLRALQWRSEQNNHQKRE